MDQFKKIARLANKIVELEASRASIEEEINRVMIELRREASSEVREKFFRRRSNRNLVNRKLSLAMRRSWEQRTPEQKAEISRKRVETILAKRNGNNQFA